MQSLEKLQIISTMEQQVKYTAYGMGLNVPETPFTNAQWENLQIIIRQRTKNWDENMAKLKSLETNAKKIIELSINSICCGLVCFKKFYSTKVAMV